MQSSHKQVCRTCLVEAKENQTLHFIYDSATKNSNQSVSELLLSTIPNLHIELKDVLPKNICMECLDTLVKLADFQRMCLQSEHQLFQLLGNGRQTHSANTDTASTTEIVPQPDPLEFEIKMLEDINLFQNNDCLVKEEIVDEIIGDKSSIGLADEDVNGDRETVKEPHVVIEDNDQEVTESNATNQILFKEGSDAPSTSLEYVCEYCNKGFNYAYRYEKHVRIHSGERPFKCTHCDKEYTQRQGLRAHLKSHTMSYKCPHCPECFAQRRQLYVHKKVHTKDKRYACDDCGASFRKRYQLTPHMKYHQGQGKHKCKYCDKSFCFGGDLRRHQLIHTDEKPYKCKYCDCTFKYTYQLNTHLRTHIGENIYRCKLCPQKFRLFKELREHMATAIHKNNDADTTHCQDHAVKEKLDDVIASEKVVMDKMEEPTEAKEGNTDTAAALIEGHKRKASGSIEDLSEDKTNDNKQLYVPTEPPPLDWALTVNNQEILENAEELNVLNTDVRNKRANKQITDEETKSKKETSQKDLVCEYCKKVFQKEMTLKIHLRTHTKEQQYLCFECGKGFANYKNMSEHLLRHGSEKRYECTECPKKFVCLSDMCKHKKKHAKIKSYVCDDCGSSFITSNELKIHKMRHTGERPYKCASCEKSFVLPFYLRRHQRTHTGEKPYKCQYCTMAYAQSNDLIKHLRKHLGENVYRCELCPQRFRFAREVREHFPSHKNEDEATRLKNLQAMQEDDEKLKAILTMPQNY